jgi:DNA polymerase elongation subunit (family B)
MQKLIYGKSNINNIVGLEVKDDTIEIFQQDDNGAVSSLFKPHRFWLLANQNIDGKFTRLKGDLYYSYGTQFTSREDYVEYRNRWKNLNTFSIWNSEEAAMVKDGYCYFQGMKHNQVSTLSFDIETNGLTMNRKSFVVLISNTYRDANGVITRKLFAHDEHASQGEMIDAWCAWVRSVNPSIICGHNIFSFDLPYLNNCSNNGLALGRDGSVLDFDNYESKFRKDGSQFLHYKKAKCYGRTLIDTMFLAIKYDVGRKYESYGLKAIIKHEGLERKDRQFYDANKIKDNFRIPSEMEKIKAYAEHDADDALALYDIMSPPFFYMAQSIPKTHQEIMLGATGSQINSIMMRAYLQDAHSLPDASEAEDYEGAISLGEIGIYTACHKVDVASLYPSIMIQYEVFDEDKDPHRYFLELVKTFTDLRLQYKKKAKEDKYFDDLQGAYKIFINSCYGFLGTAGLLFNSPAGAAFITATGREVLQTSINWAKAKGYTIVNADTDSITYSDPNSTLVNPEVRKSNLSELNALYPEKIRFEDDGFFKRVLVFAPKNYVLQKEDSSIKIKGSALKDAKRELALKDFANEVIQELLGDGDHNRIQKIYYKYIREVKYGIKDIKRWCSKKTITDKIFTSERSNETKVKDAIQGSNYREGDKVWTFFKSDGSLCLMENYNGDYDKDSMYKKVFRSAEFFTNVIPADLFTNYSLKRSKKELEEL